MRSLIFFELIQIIWHPLYKIETKKWHMVNRFYQTPYKFSPSRRKLLSSLSCPISCLVLASLGLVVYGDKHYIWFQPPPPTIKHFGSLYMYIAPLPVSHPSTSVSTRPSTHPLPIPFLFTLIHHLILHYWAQPYMSCLCLWQAISKSHLIHM